MPKKENQPHSKRICSEYGIKDCPTCKTGIYAEKKEPKCDICRNTGETRHYSLYVFGSEGVNLCQNCQIMICELLRKVRNAVFTVK